jgi:hypothetical protein
MNVLDSWGSTTSTWLKQHCGSPAEYCRFQSLASCGLRKLLLGLGLISVGGHLFLRRLFEVRVPDSNEFVLPEHLFDGSLVVL